MVTCLRPSRVHDRDICPVARSNTVTHRQSKEAKPDDPKHKTKVTQMGMIQVDIPGARESTVTPEANADDDYENDDILHFREQQEMVHQISILWYEMEGQHIDTLEQIDLDYVHARWKIFLHELGEAL